MEIRTQERDELHPVIVNEFASTALNTLPTQADTPEHSILHAAFAGQYMV